MLSHSLCKTLLYTFHHNSALCFLTHLIVQSTSSDSDFIIFISRNNELAFNSFYRFSKIRVSPKNGLVRQDDFRFAISEGNPVNFGRAGDCFSLGKCRRGGFQVDLSGTGFQLRDDVRWGSWGTPKGSRMINFTRSPDRTRASAVCGGSCGGCQPEHGRIYLVPSSCDAPLGMCQGIAIYRVSFHAIVECNVCTNLSHE